MTISSLKQVGVGFHIHHTF